MADISKIKIPDGTSLNIKDATARQAIENLPKPMVFKGSLGTGGTITSLPTAASSNTGYVYKVIEAGTYASQSAKIGDTFVSDGSSWVLIPSGDEPSGTVTSIKIQATSPISINNSEAITTSGTRTISHASSGVSSGTYKSVTVNSTGHVTAGTNPTTIDGYGITDSAGRIVEGKEYTIGSNTIVAGTGAEVFNEYDGTNENIAVGDYSHAEGKGTVAYGDCQHVEGKYNVRGTGSNLAFIIGNGTSSSDTSNAFAIDWNGRIYIDNAETGVDVNELAENVEPIPKLVDDGAKNLLKNTAAYGDLVRTNLTFTHNDDDTYVVNATSANTANTDLYVATDMPIKAGTYVLSGCPGGGNNSNTFKLQVAGIGYDLGGRFTFTIAQDTTISVYIRIWAGYIPDNLVFKPMICTVEEYVVSSEYIPYAPSNRGLYEEIETKTTMDDIYGIKTAISNGTDLNTMQTPGAYACGGATVAASLLNCPTTTDAFIMYVDNITTESRIIQRLYAMNTSTGVPCVYIRALYSGGWGAWHRFEGTDVADDTWITLKSGSDTGIGASDVKYRLNGKTMCITGYVTPSSNAASVTIGTLAEKYRPISLQTGHVSQASGIAETAFSAQVLTDGTVKFQGNSASAITINTQYYFTLTYIVAN